MAEAAGAWLDGFDSQQQQVATGAVPGDDVSDAERRRWFCTPTDRGGLTFHAQRPARQRAAMRPVASGLSTPAYVMVAAILGLENVLDHVEGFVIRFDRERWRDPEADFGLTCSPSTARPSTRAGVRARPVGDVAGQA